MFLVLHFSPKGIDIPKTTFSSNKDALIHNNSNHVYRPSAYVTNSLLAAFRNLLLGLRLGKLIQSLYIRYSHISWKLPVSFSEEYSTFILNTYCEIVVWEKYDDIFFTPRGVIPAVESSGFPDVFHILSGCFHLIHTGWHTVTSQSKKVL